MTEPEKRPAYEPAGRLLTPPRYDPTMKRPASTVAGALLVMLSVVAGAVQLGEIAVRWDSLTAPTDLSGDLDLGPDTISAGLTVTLATGGAILAVQALLAMLIYLGRNTPRVIVMTFAVLEICGSFAGWWAGGQQITLRTSLVTVAVDILLLLALSSRSASAYARRHERPPDLQSRPSRHPKARRGGSDLTGTA